MLKLRDDAGKLNNISHPTALPGIEFFKPKDFMTFESTKFAFDGMMRGALLDYTGWEVGKTTLAKVVGNTTKEHKMFNEVVMVVVSQTLNVMNIQDQIADSLSMKLEEKSEQGRARRLCLRLKGENKILLILDDVWTKLDLTTIGIPFGDEHMGCKILITTRVKQVCISMNCQWKVQLNVLNREEGLNLFKKHAGVSNHSPPLDGIAKEVVDECNGLALAIVTVASLLREKDVDEWKVVCQKLRNSKLDDIENVDVDVYACLKLSYDYLKGDEIKLCFLLCSLFPEDHKIELEELVRYGLGDLERFPFNTLLRLPRLEELYIGNNFFSKWGVEGNASLSELNKLSHLVIVALSISSKCLPQDFAFQNLIRYEIRVNANARMSYPTTTTLRIKNVEMTAFFAFKALFQTAEHLELEGINGCQNVVPNIDQRGLKLLNSLQLKNVPELEYIIDMTQQQVPDKAFSNLTILSLHGMSHLREICSGGSPSMGFLENLRRRKASVAIKLENIETEPPIRIDVHMERADPAAYIEVVLYLHTDCHLKIIVEDDGKDPTFKLSNLSYN
ncbi:hypothetical protein EZV62_008267 [Acer yangbiense]|uniref:NB-ARC domain-containing protein n=1 Tax=Acer yangbiense TaxID=1000413 RepID=A0A5C7IDN6_9ROSI|nr:hypothetical protein EZV62_008267 [Acer yangbiense]